MTWTPPLGAWYMVVATFLLTCAGEGGLPLPFVWSAVLLFTGYELAQGYYLRPGAMVLASVLGSVTGALLVYALAQRLGKPFVRKVWRLLRLRDEWFTKAEARLARVGIMSVAQARLVPGIALPASIIAGLSRVSIRRFATGIVVSEMLTIPFFVGAGFVTGISGVQPTRAIAWFPVVLIGLGLAMAGARVAKYLVSHRQSD
jgi:membrane protein DedA with SNARE-associated domain